MEEKLTLEEEAYLNQLSAEIAAVGGLNGLSVIDAMTAAHQRRQAFAMEMATGSTKRSKMARKALQASVWMECNRRAAQERLAMQAKSSTHAMLMSCESIENSS